MSIIAFEMEKLKRAIAAGMPARFVSGSLIEHEELRRAELLQGVITVLLERIKNDDDWTSTLQVLITGQLEVELPVDKDGMGALVESAEINLYSELRSVLRQLGNLPGIEVEGVEFSAHSKAPFGWFLLRAQYGPINEACTDWDFGDLPAPPNMYPPSVLITPLGGVDIKVDIEPHESAAVHQKWLLGEKKKKKPDMIFTVELNNGN